MRDLNWIGGLASLFLAAAYIFGFALFFGAIDWTGYEGPAGDVAFISDYETVLTVAMSVLYPVAGCALVALSVAMHRYATAGQDGLVQIATAFGLIWAGIVVASGMVSLIGMQTVIELAPDHPDTATSAWVAISVVQDALGGGIELVGGVWMAMISWLALRAGAMPKALAWIGVLVGLAGIATLLPALSGLTVIFGLGQIIWFVWLGVVLIRATRSDDFSVYT